MSIINAPPASFHVLGTIIATTDHLTTEGIINQILLGEEHRIRESGTTARECILREKQTAEDAKSDSKPRVLGRPIPWALVKVEKHKKEASDSSSGIFRVMISLHDFEDLGNRWTTDSGACVANHVVESRPVLPVSSRVFLTLSTLCLPTITRSERETGVGRIAVQMKGGDKWYRAARSKTSSTFPNSKKTSYRFLNSFVRWAARLRLHGAIPLVV
ncbi:hypothetical protein DFH94DRAFT_681253 [Russula ochroleuca]|uniref:Uncharacterized protein n=1 Tax=Russula ochroleuca TaxID=152965 RepID=A0A9P5TAI3_9AGAM|nr:hypothetical protein DFH94DRAFT_681253 [Russula ochroleuca]